MKIDSAVSPVFDPVPTRGPVRRALEAALGGTRAQPVLEYLHRLTLFGMGFGSSAAETSQSGEAAALRHARRSLPPGAVVFDVGAHFGEWRTLAREVLGADARILSFEPSPVSYQRLRAACKAAVPEAEMFNFALGENQGKLPLYTLGGDSGLNSVYNRRVEHHGLRRERGEAVRVETIDGICARLGIERIDFLKLDVEGHEFPILRGASELLARNAIRFIQWEFGGCNIDSRTFFQDFWYLLSPHFRISRVVRDGLRLIPKYSERLEIFVTSNFLAERREPSR